MNKTKRVIALILVVIMLFAAAGCGGSQSSSGQKEGTHVVVDHLDYEVEVPYEINRIAVANILPILDPEAIFITGGLAKAGDLILEPTEKAMRASLLRIYGDVKLALSQINDDNAAVRGASALVW